MVSSVKPLYTPYTDKPVQQLTPPPAESDVIAVIPKNWTSNLEAIKRYWIDVWPVTFSSDFTSWTAYKSWVWHNSKLLPKSRHARRSCHWLILAPKFSSDTIKCARLIVSWGELVIECSKNIPGAMFHGVCSELCHNVTTVQQPSWSIQDGCQWMSCNNGLLLKVIYSIKMTIIWLSFPHKL